MFKLFVTAAEDLWTLNANDLGQSMMQNVFANLAISKNLRDSLFPFTYSTLLPGQDRIPNYLIDETAYYLTPYSMKEYHSCSSNPEVMFNNLLRTARNQVKGSFRRLKARWGFSKKNGP